MTLLQRPAQVSVAATVAAGLLMLLLAGQYVVRKHLWAETSLVEIEPRFARVLGLRDAGAQLNQSLKDSRVALARLGHPGDRDAAQVGNDLQQVARRGLEAAGLVVTSSQVLATRSEAGFDRVSAVIQAEGTLSGLQIALAALQVEMPAIAIEGVVLQPIGRSGEDGSPVVSCRLTVAVLRLQS